LHSWNFDGKSAIILPKLRILHNRISIYVQIQPLQKSGVIFYAWQTDSPTKGDFILLALANSRVFISYSLGDGPMTLFSHEEIIARRQYTLEAICSGEHASLSIDGAAPVVLSVPSESSKRHLNIDSPAYVGYIPNRFYSLGDGPMTLFSHEEIIARRQYTLEAICSGRHLNIDSPAYVGYIPNRL
uniref:LAM_G_DOMAIN domain-containing protein n=1 Tax=Toxocara canis TaxID=6265 RepID=A0A183U4K3_TOXCA